MCTRWLYLSAINSDIRNNPVAYLESRYREAARVILEGYPEAFLPTFESFVDYFTPREDKKFTIDELYNYVDDFLVNLDILSWLKGFVVDYTG